MSFERYVLQLCFFYLISAAALAQQAGQQTPAPGSVPGTVLVEPMLPYTPSLDVTAMDRSVDPCIDFYTYSCGGWQKKNPIPPDQVSWSVYGKLYQDNLVYLRGILEQASTSKDRDAVGQKIGDYYAACMDEAAVEKLGAKPLQPELGQIQALQSAKEIAPLLAGMHLAGDSSMFRSGSQQDPDNSDAMIVAIAQGGLGLPDRDYYTKDDAKSKEIRARYMQHVQKRICASRRSAGDRKERGGNRYARRNRPGEGFLDASGAPRPLQDQAHHEGHRSQVSGAQL